jgi:hypothetical protein
MFLIEIVSHGRRNLSLKSNIDDINVKILVFLISNKNKSTIIIFIEHKWKISTKDFGFNI